MAEGTLAKTPSDLDGLLDALRDDLDRTLGGKLVNEAVSNPDGGRGRMLIVETPQRGKTPATSAHVQVVVAGDRVFQVVSVQPTGKHARPEEAERVHASFRLR